jgi:hypothetical protein
MAKSVQTNLNMAFNLDGVQNGSEDVAEQTTQEYALRRRQDGKVKLADGDVTVPLAGITPKTIMVFNRGGGSISIKLSGAVAESVNIGANGFMAISSGSASAMVISTGSTTDVFYEYLLLGD